MVSSGLKGNCDNCNSEVRRRILTTIPEWHPLKQSTEWQYLCTSCAIEFNVPLCETRKQSRIRRGLVLPKCQQAEVEK